MNFLGLLDLEIQADLGVPMALMDSPIIVHLSDLLESEDQMHHHAQQYLRSSAEISSGACTNGQLVVHINLLK